MLLYILKITFLRLKITYIFHFTDYFLLKTHQLYSIFYIFLEGIFINVLCNFFVFDFYYEINILFVL